MREKTRVTTADGKPVWTGSTYYAVKWHNGDWRLVSATVASATLSFVKDTNGQYHHQSNLFVDRQKAAAKFNQKVRSQLNVLERERNRIEKRISALSNKIIHYPSW